MFLSASGLNRRRTGLVVRCGMERGLGRPLGQAGIKHLHCYWGCCAFWSCLTLVRVFQSTSCTGQVLNCRKMSEREQLEYEGKHNHLLCSNLVVLHNGMYYLGFQGICSSVLLHVAVHRLKGLARISPAGHSFWWFSLFMSDVTQSPFHYRKELPVIFRRWQYFGRGHSCDGWVIHIWFLLLFSLFGINYLMTKPKCHTCTRNGLLEVSHQT